MEYLFLFISCLFFSIQFIFGKYYERSSNGSYAAGLWCSMVNALIMLIYLLPKCGFRLEISLSAIICSLAYAVSSLLCTGFSILAMRRGKLGVVTTYELLGGFMLPFVWGVIAYGEAFTLWKAAGLVCIILAVCFGVLRDAFAKKTDAGEEQKQKSSFVFFLFCMILFFTNGIISIATTASQKAADAVSSDGFLLLCLAEIAGISFVLLLFHGIRRASRGEAHGVRNAFLEIGDKHPMTAKIYGLMILFCGLHSVCNGIGNIFSLTCAKTMDASIQFPLSSAVMILLSTAVSAVVLREKPDRADAIRLLLAVGGTAFFLI